MIEIHEGGGMTITGKEDIGLYRLYLLQSALRLECKGMKMSRGRSVYSVVKREFGFRGSKQKVLEQLEAYIKEAEQPPRCWICARTEDQHIDEDFDAEGCCTRRDLDQG